MTGETARRTKPPADPGLAATTPPGVQPEQHGHLLCLECGGWHRRLDPHLRAGHGLTSAAYRELHGLRVGHPLASQEVRTRFSDNARDQMDRDPQRWEQHFAHSPEDRAEFAARGRAVVTSTLDRAERRATTRKNGDTVGALRSDEAREVLERRVRALGYADLVAFLTARREDSQVALARGAGRHATCCWGMAQAAAGRGPGRGGQSRPRAASCPGREGASRWLRGLRRTDHRHQRRAGQAVGTPYSNLDEYDQAAPQPGHRGTVTRRDGPSDLSPPGRPDQNYRSLLIGVVVTGRPR